MFVFKAAVVGAGAELAQAIAAAGIPVLLKGEGLEGARALSVPLNSSSQQGPSGQTTSPVCHPIDRQRDEADGMRVWLPQCGGMRSDLISDLPYG